MRVREQLAGAASSLQGARFIGIDLGAETLRLIEITQGTDGPRISRRGIWDHGKNPGPVLVAALKECDWEKVSGAAATGRFAGQVALPRVPAKQAQLRGYQFLFGQEPASIVNIGSHGFSALEIRPGGLTVFRENSRCSQGTGNFLRQLVERFSLTVEEASKLCADVKDPAPLSGRCPVILKTDMTHLANKGEAQPRILAGLFDAVCENVLALLKPAVSPPRVLLTGGVSRSPRVRRVFRETLARQGMELIASDEADGLFLEALGCALIAATNPGRVPSLSELLQPPRPVEFERLPGLADSLGNVRRLPAKPWAIVNGEFRRLVLGFDIGSTGAKLVALDSATQETVWEGYRQTLGDPVGAAQDLLLRFTQTPAAKYPVVAFGATGSGREIVGSLLTSCFGKEAVFVVNEIVAHATGALCFDSHVDTIFEIGGQDAKYIRLAEGRIIDCAMNEACSAGTGSFIEEQGRKFAGIADVRQLGEAALAAKAGVSLGQHCSVFMAEVIDEGVAAGVEPPALISGLYDSIIKNYLNRVKGNRSVGNVIFCQGMPFSADALAAAVARQTGSRVIVPPNPGTVGALGIALLASRELDTASHGSLDAARFLGARVEQKDTFVCRATSGCGAPGNRCRIERLRTVADAGRAVFTWGGGCALHDKASRKKKLPDLAPDPFREREELLERIIAPLRSPRGLPRVALTDEFVLKGLFPFFTTFFHHAGFDLEILCGADQATLKRGIQMANVPFCAPMQLFHGLAERLAETGADWIFLPMVRSLPRDPGQRCANVCPILQASPDVVRCVLERTSTGQGTRSRLLSCRIDFGEKGYDSEEFLASGCRLAKELGLSLQSWKRAWREACRAQREFDEGCLEIGRRALEFCRVRTFPPVVVLGRNYTIHNRVLNSNVPAILREQGAVGIPVDCYPVSASTPHFSDMYWSYGQALVRAAHQIRRTPGHYGLYCSNYSCGPDSFNQHFAAYSMDGKPFAIIETDGHSGDAGTKTRVEAFLHCVEEDRRAVRPEAPLRDFGAVCNGRLRLRDIGRQNGATEKMLVPWIGCSSRAVAAVFRGLGFASETLPPPDIEALRQGRRFTSGKECLPMPMTLGVLLQRLARAQDGERFVYVMPGTNGPCRFGIYNLLNRIVLEQLGWRDRVRIWSPTDTGYFDDLPPGTDALMYTGIFASDLLHQALLDVRPRERVPGTADAVFERYLEKLLRRLEAAASGGLRLAPALWQVASGRLFAITDLLVEAGEEFARLRGPGELPVVELTGEIYVRAVEFSNDFLIRKLESRGLRVRLAPASEWITYCGYLRRHANGRNRLADRPSDFLQGRIEAKTFTAVGGPLGWLPAPTIPEVLATAQPYINSALEGEAVLTLGASLAAWRRQEINAVLAVGPLECMPTKIAEAQFQHVMEREGLLTLTLAFNGDPISDAALDNFAYEVHARFNGSAEKELAH